MRVTVVGSWGGSPRAGGACSGYLVEHGGARLLLDCGPGVASALQFAAPLNGVDHVVVSHFHYDHASDAGALMYARLVQRKVGMDAGDVTFYALPGSVDFERLTMEGASRAVAVDEGDVVEIGPFACSFMRTKHPVACLAVRVACEDGAVLAYTADGALTPELVRFAAHSDVLITECSLYPGYDGSVMGHMSCEDVVKLAEGARPRTLVVGHLPIYGDATQIGAWVTEHLSAGSVERVVLADAPCTAQGALALEVVPKGGAPCSR